MRRFIRSAARRMALAAFWVRPPSAPSTIACWRKEALLTMTLSGFRRSCETMARSSSRLATAASASARATRSDSEVRSRASALSLSSVLASVIRRLASATSRYIRSRSSWRDRSSSKALSRSLFCWRISSMRPAGVTLPSSSPMRATSSGLALGACGGSALPSSIVVPRPGTVSARKVSMSFLAARSPTPIPVIDL